MAQDEYILTSDDEAFALAEQGCRLLLGLVEDAFTTAVGHGLTAALYAQKDGKWGDGRQEAQDEMNIETGYAQRLLGRAIGTPLVVRNHAHPHRGYMYSLSESSGLRAFRQLGVPNDGRWAARIEALREAYRRSADGRLRDDIEALYAATNPTLVPEFAETLLPEACRA